MLGQVFVAKLLALVTEQINQELLDAIDYLQEEIRVLRRNSPRRLRLNNTDRMTLAQKAQKLGRGIAKYANIVTPDTLYRWHRKFVAQKFDGSKKRNYPGRPTKLQEIEDMAVRIALENPGKGVYRIAGELHNLGYDICKETVRQILIRHGIDPAPVRGKRKSWAEFIALHADVIWACDFFTVEVWEGFRLTTFHVLFFIHLQTRRVVLGGITNHATGAWCEQVAREVTGFDQVIQMPGRKGYLIHDRAACFTERFATAFKAAGIEPKKLPPRSPNLNAFAERFVRSIKHECINHIIFIGERSLRRAVTQYIEHYHTERNHQGLDNVMPFPDERYQVSLSGSGPIAKQSRLGGLLNYHYRKAA